MSACKNPYEFTDSILVRELRRRVDKHDDRIEVLIEVIEQRLRERKLEPFRARVEQLRRLRQLEARDTELRGMVATLLDRLEPRHYTRRPSLTLIRGGHGA